MAKSTGECVQASASTEVTSDLNCTLGALDRTLGVLDCLAYALYGDCESDSNPWPEPLADKVCYARDLASRIEDKVASIYGRLG